MADLLINIKTTGEEIAAGALRRTGGVIEGVFQGIGQAAFNLLGNAVSGAFDSIKASMIDGNAEFERYQTQFGVLLGDAGLAKQRLEELAEFGAKTPFELPQVVRADKILQAFGLHADDVADRFGFSGEQIRTIAGDVAAGTGASFEEISTYLGKFASGATGEAISRMQELGIVTRQQLSEMGLEFSKSGQLLTPVDDAMDVLLAAMKDKFGGMMDAQSSTFEGMMSNLQDWFGAAGRTIGKPLFDVAKEGLGKLLEMLNGLMPLIEAFAESLGQAVTDVVSMLQAGESPIDAFATAIGDIFGLDVATKAEPLFAAMETIGAAAQNVMAAFASSMPMIQTYVADMLAFVQQQFASVSPQLIANVSEALNQIAVFWTEHGETIMAVVSGVWRFLVVTIGGALTLISGIIAATLQLINGDSAGAWQTIQDTWATFVQSTLDIVGVKLDEFLETWAGVWQQLQVIISLGIIGAIDNLKAFGQAFVDLGVGLMRALAGGILQGVADAIASATGAAQAIVDAIKRTLGISSPSKVFAGLGANMMLGMAQGIAAGSGAPIGMARSVSSNIVNNSGGNTYNYYGVQADTQMAYQRALAGSF